MSVGSITGAKGLAQSYKPLLLCTFTFPGDGSTLRVCSDPLSTAQGGYPYGGNNYLARVTNQDIATYQAMADGGIDMPGSVTIEMADPDKLLFLTWDQQSGRGFKGAALEMRLVLWNVGANDFSSDSKVIFQGVCDRPGGTATHLTINAVTKLDFNKVFVPPARVQKRCFNIFPTTAAERTAGNNDPSSTWYECGYCPEEGVGTAGFTDCGYTSADCKARGMYQHGRFSGITFAPNATFREKSFTEGGKEVFGINSNNEAKYSDFIPLIYGKGWIQPLIMNEIGGGDSTRFEAVVCMGEVDDISNVVVNDVHLDQATLMDSTPQSVPDPLLAWNIVNRGSRNGAPNLLPGYDGKGDPYGSMCAITGVVFKRIADSESAPNVKVLVSGPKIRTFTGNGDAGTLQGAPANQNPVWQLIDLMTWGPVTYADINLDLAATTAAICDQTVSYVDANGVTVSRPRYSSSLILRDRRSIAQVIRGLRTANGLIVYQRDGKIQIEAEGTLASQQPSPVTGSNDTTAYTSVLRSGTGANGYVAYHFDESNIRMTGSGATEKSTLQLAPQAIASSPNVITTTFQDADWGYFPDSLTMRDAKDIGRAGREVDTSLQIDGIQTYDQAKRILTRTFARYNRGNLANDTRGTLVFKFSTTVQASHLHVGHIVSLSHEQWGFDRNLFRIRAITPQMNFDTVDIELEYHRDAWFRDDFGQLPDGDNTNPRRNQLPRPAWAWQPNTVFPLAGDPLYSVTDGTFAVSQSYEDLSDNNKLARVTISGKLPQNNFGSVPPPFARQANGSSTGGSLHAGTVYWAVICAKDTDGVLSAPSGPAPIKAVLPNGSTAGSFTIPNISWAQDTSGYALFASDDPNKLTKQLEGSGTPSSLTVTTLNKRTQGAPDIEFDHFRWDIRRIRHSGVAYGIVGSRTATTITLTGVSLTPNQFNGREVSVISLDSTDPVPFASFKIASHTATVLTLAGGSPSPITAGVTAGAVLIFRSVPTAGSDGTGNYISDALWQNSEYPDGLEPDAEQGNDLLCIAGSGQGFSYRIKANDETKIWIDGDWTITPDATSRFIVVEPVGISNETSSIDNSDPAADSNWTVDVSNYKGQPLLVTAVSVDGGGDGSWANTNPFREIYIYGNLSETPGGIPNPDDVTINLATATIVENTYIPSAFYTAPSDVLFKGVHGYLEAPAVTGSSRLGTDALGDFQLPPERIDLGKRPYDATQNNSAGQQLIQFDAQDLPQTGFTARLYLAPYSDDVDVPLRAIDDASPTPNATFAVPSRQIFGTGQEHVPNVRNVQVTLPGSYLTGNVWYFRVNVTWEDPQPGDANYNLFQRVNVEFVDAAGKSMGSGYVAKGEQKFNWPQGVCPPTDEQWSVRVFSADAQGNQNTYSRGITPEITFTAPQVPPTPHVTGFAVIVGYGYDIDGKISLILAPYFHRPADDRGFQSIEFRIRDHNGAFVVLGRPANPADVDPGARAYIEQQFWPQTFPQTWRAYAVPVSYAGIPLYGADDPSAVGDSPYVDVTIPEYRGDAGMEFCLNPVAFAIEAQYPLVGADGVETYQFRWKITPPDDERFAGADIIVVPESDPVRSIVIASSSRDDDPDTWFHTDSWPVPNPSETFDAFAVGFNYAGDRNTWPVLDVTPLVENIDVAPQSTGHLNAGRLSPGTLNINHFDNATGVLKWTGDPNVFADGAGHITVKLDPDNTVGISTNGIFINSVPFNKAKSGTYDTDIFSIPSGTFGVKFDTVSNSQLQKTTNGISVKQIDAAIINTGILRVGNITNSPSYVGVYKLVGGVQTLIAWVGHNATYGGLEGGWFKELYVGGADPLNPKLFADSSGNLTLTGNILASTITGSTLTLLKNNVQTTITNFQEPAYGGAFVGVAVANLTASGRRSIMTAGGVACINPLQIAVADMYADSLTNNGAVRVFNSLGALKCSMNGVDGSVHADLFNCGGFDGLGTTGSPVIILYTKSGGASGSMTFRGGLLVAQT